MANKPTPSKGKGQLVGSNLSPVAQGPGFRHLRTALDENFADGNRPSATATTGRAKKPSTKTKLKPFPPAKRK